MDKEQYMQLALDEARKGYGHVSPNPLVGAVIVKNGKIIGKGAHLKYGKAHAEVNAIESATESCVGAEMYVTLEPCAHHGKTPPCADRIIKEGFKIVYIGIRDPFPEVDGRGIEKLLAAGIKVEVGILEKECRKINEPFFISVNKKRPYFFLKSATSLDGCICTTSGESKWISGEESRRYVHFLRTVYDAVLVGKKTIKHDDPSLTVRNYSGRNPLRIAVDEEVTHTHRKLYRDEHCDKTILFTTNKTDNKIIEDLLSRGVRVEVVSSDERGFVELDELICKLHELRIQSVIVEGGRVIATEFLRRQYIDRLGLFIAPKIIGSGINFIKDFGLEKLSHAPIIENTDLSEMGDDFYVTGILRYAEE